MLQFSKMQALGNDFIILDSRNTQTEPSATMIKKLSHRRLGIGCDQLLYLNLNASKNHHYHCSIYNADGKRVEQCANGMRCLAQYIDQSLHWPENIAITLDSGFTTAKIRKDSRGYTTILTYPRYKQLQQLTLADQHFSLHLVDAGNPHAIIFTSNLEHPKLSAWGTALRQHPVFAQGINVSFITQEKHHCTAVVFERGVGATPACGSAAAAIFVVCQKLDNSLKNLDIHMPGGKLFVSHQETQLELLGPSMLSFSGQFCWENLAKV
jgi:diaminopimelate epimerase